MSGLGDDPARSGEAGHGTWRDGDADRDEGVIERDAVDDMGSMTDTGILEGELASRTPDSDQPDDPIAGNLESLTALELRSDETSNPDEAAEEGMTWVPPVDPPTAGYEGGAADPRVAAGFGTTALDEPYDADHHRDEVPAEDEVTDRVREALLADSETTGYADGLAIETEGGVVTIAGEVEDLDDEDAIVSVATRVSGVADVRSRLRVTSLD